VPHCGAPLLFLRVEADDDAHGDESLLQREVQHMLVKLGQPEVAHSRRVVHAAHEAHVVLRRGRLENQAQQRGERRVRRVALDDVPVI